MARKVSVKRIAKRVKQLFGKDPVSRRSKWWTKKYWTVAKEYWWPKDEKVIKETGRQKALRELEDVLNRGKSKKESFSWPKEWFVEKEKTGKNLEKRKNKN